MYRTWVAAVALIVAVALPSVMSAHEGHPHRFMGTVSAAESEQIEVETTDGAVVTFKLDETTVYRQGKSEVVARLLEVGERVVVSALEVEEGQTMIAEIVQLPVPATASR